MRNYLFWIMVSAFFFVSMFKGFSQKGGKVEIVADARIAGLVETNILFNEKVKTAPGYRILIASLSGNNSKASAYGIKGKFMAEYEGIEAYFCFEEPNFKVKVGDFKTGLEAFAFLQKIKSSYPNAYVIKDNVYPFKMEKKDTLPDDDLDN